MISLDPNTLYTKTELLKTIGPGAFRLAQAAGLHAVGDLYLGKIILETISAAHEAINIQRAAQKKEGNNGNETTKMEEDKPNRQIQPIPGSKGAKDFQRKMEEKLRDRNIR